MKYVMFSKSTCPFCSQAQELLEKSNKNYKIVDFKEPQQELLQEIKDAYDWPTVPMVFELRSGSDIKFIGGYSDLVSYFEQQ